MIHTSMHNNNKILLLCWSCLGIVHTFRSSLACSQAIVALESLALSTIPHFCRRLVRNNQNAETQFIYSRFSADVIWLYQIIQYILEQNQNIFAGSCLATSSPHAVPSGGRNDQNKFSNVSLFNCPFLKEVLTIKIRKSSDNPLLEEFDIVWETMRTHTPCNLDLSISSGVCQPHASSPHPPPPTSFFRFSSCGYVHQEVIFKVHYILHFMCICIWQ